MARSIDQTNDPNVFQQLLTVLDITPDQHEDQSNEQTDVPAVKGMINVANRCFLLSVLQALFSCKPFAAYINQASQIIEQAQPDLHESSRLLVEHNILSQLKPIAPVLTELIAYDIHARHGLNVSDASQSNESVKPDESVKPEDADIKQSNNESNNQSTDEVTNQITNMTVQDAVQDPVAEPDTNSSSNEPTTASTETSDHVDESSEWSTVSHSASKSSKRRRRKKGTTGIDAALSAPQSVSPLKQQAPARQLAMPAQPKQPSRQSSASSLNAVKRPHDPTAAFLPAFPHLLSLFQPRHHGRQEDVAELLLFIINQCQREIEAVRKHRISLFGSPVHTTSVVNGDDDWVEVGSRSRALPVRSNVKIEPTPIANMFAITVRSKLSVASKNAGSISFQPFFILPLDLSGEVKTLDQAINQFMSTTSVDGFRTSANATRSKTAHQSQSLDATKLPQIFTFQLKRFDAHSTKLDRRIEFETSLTLRPQWLSNAHSLDELRYDLAAVIVHHGSSVQNGHYTAFVRRHDRWYHMDDMRVTSVTDKAVMQTSAYILMYTRAE